jgi:hypothetical protein
MLRLSDPQRVVLVQAVPAVANLGVGAMLFGQFVRDRPFSAGLAASGIVFWFAAIGFTLWLTGAKR